MIIFSNCKHTKKNQIIALAYSACVWNCASATTKKAKTNAKDQRPETKKKGGGRMVAPLSQKNLFMKT